MRIQHNIPAMSAYRNYTNNVSAMQKNLEKLSSGYKINRAGDDAAGLAISEKMRAQITGLETAQKNAKDGISLVQTAEGALTEVHDMSNRMVELATQSANGTYDNNVDRAQMQKELDQLRTEINRIADSSNFNGIKLFDGSLSGADITTEGITTESVDMAKGVEVVQGGNGGGTKGEYTIDVTSAFGDGDELAITFGGAADGAGSSGTVTLEYGATAGTNITGDTLEKQAQSIAQALGAISDVSSNFSIVAEGTTVKLTCLKEGNKLTDGDADQVGTVTSVTVTNKTAKQDTTWKETEGVANGTEGIIKYEKLFDGNTGTSKDIPEGSTMTFKFTLTNGNERKVTLKAGEDFAIGTTTKDTVTNIKNALEKANFDQNEDTVMDETAISVGDMFTIALTGDEDGLTFTDKTSSVDTTTTKNTFTGADSQAKDCTSTAAVTTTTAAKAGEYVMALTAADATNLSIGDKLTIKGELADGRTFEFEVEAGKDFKVDASNYKGATSTMANLKKLLEDTGMNIELKNSNGQVVDTVNTKDIFGTAANKKEIELDATNGKFVNNIKGKEMVSKITEVKLTAGADTAVSESLNNGLQKTSANSTITFSEGVEYGATVEVGGKKYEIVRDADEVSNSKNTAVVVKDISDTDAVARAMGEALKGDLNANNYKVSTSGSKVTVSTVEVGSTAKAITAQGLGDKLTQLEFTLDPSKMKHGSTVTINDKTYEFVEKGGKTSAAGNVAVEVGSMDNETSKSLGSAIAAAVSGSKDVQATTDDAGKVTVRGLADNKGNITTPTVKFDGGKGGLTLQIGDTAEDFNQMTVSIHNMHTADMGIGDIRIDSQDAAAEAVDKIKEAINYVSDVRGSLGATQNRLDHTMNNLSVMTENIQDAESSIRDTDVAAEMMEYTKNNILIQSAQAMLAQANQMPQGVLQLLQ